MKRLILVLGLLTASGFAQFSLPPIRVQSSDPANCTTTGGIGELKIYYNTSTSSFKFCSAANTWSPFTSSPFASGGTTNNVIPKSNGSSALADSSITDNGTVVSGTEPLRLADGVIGTPSYSFTSATGTGFFISGGHLTAVQGGAGTAVWSGLNYALASTGSFSFSSTSSPDGGSDLFLRRRAPANLALGTTDVNGVPVAQTISFQNAITGSNLPGVQATIAGVLGTGTGLPSPVVVQGADASVASGTTAQTEINRLVVGDTKNLTTGAATTVLSVPLATLQMMGGTIDYYMEATDGTNQCTSKGTVDYSGENSAGVFVVGVTAIGNLTSSCTATKTLTATWAVTSANPSLIQITPTLTGITATRFTLVYEVHHMGNTNPTL